MAIRVAYDISVLARSFQNPSDRSGVYRSIEELLYGLNKRDDINLTAMGICGDDLLLDSIYSSLYVKDRRAELECEFAAGFKSRLKLEPLYRQFLEAKLAKGEGPPKNSLSAAYARTMTGLLYRLNYGYGIDKVSHIFDSGRYDLFHSPFLPLPPKDLISGIPRVLTIYDLIFVNNPEFMTRELCELLQRVLESIDIERDWVACISEFTKLEFCEHTGMAAERVVVTPLAAPDWFRVVEDEDEIAAAAQRYGIPEGHYFLAVATFQPRKNLAHLIRSFFKLLAEHPDLPVSLVLVGTPSWEYEATFAEAASSAFKSRVIFTGYAPDQDLSALYSGARAFVFPSLYEGFGLPVLEAMQCGTPVIASNTTALPEVAGDAGLLIDPTDSEALCQAMLALVNDDQLRISLSQKGLERSKLFSWERCAEQTVGLYRKALQTA